jgi:hypothetical protein
MYHYVFGCIVSVYECICMYKHICTVYVYTYMIVDFMIIHAYTSPKIAYEHILSGRITDDVWGGGRPETAAPRPAAHQPELRVDTAASPQAVRPADAGLRPAMPAQGPTPQHRLGTAASLLLAPCSPPRLIIR